MEKPKQGGGTKAWVERNWLLLLLIIVGLAGLLIALALFLVPCERELVTITTRTNVTSEQTTTIITNKVSPLVTTVALDGSGSVGDRFYDTLKPAASIFVLSLNSTLDSFRDVENITEDSRFDLSTGLTQWTNGLPQVEIAITEDESEVSRRLLVSEGEDQIVPITQNIGTSIATALISCGGQLLDNSNPILTEGSQSLCLILSDGISWDRANIFVSEDAIGDTVNYYEEECSETFVGENLCQYAPTNEAGIAIYGYCQELGLQTCTTLTLSEELQRRGIIISGVFIGNDAAGQEFLHKVTSCDPVSPYNRDTAVQCPYFSSSDFDSLQEDARLLAQELVSSASVEVTSNTTTEQVTTEVVDITTDLVCTTEPIYFFFLVMFIPLGLYIFWRPISLFFAKYCCPPKPVPLVQPELEEEQLYTPPVLAPVSTRISSPVPTPVMSMRRDPVESWVSEPEEPVVEAFTPPPAAPAPEPNTLVKSKRYRWSIKAADAYLWNLGASGVAPLNVNFNGVAPPSAPKQEATEENMKRKTQRISLRWSYVPPPIEEEEELEGPAPESRPPSNRRSRVSQRVVSMAAAVVPQWEPPVHLEPFPEDEIQPGDIDYEYTMCLMRYCPCLRPTDPFKNSPDAGKPLGQSAPVSHARGGSGNSLSTVSSNGSGEQTGQFDNPRFENVNFDSSYYSIPKNRGSESTVGSSYPTLQSNGSRDYPSQRPSRNGTMNSSNSHASNRPSRNGTMNSSNSHASNRPSRNGTMDSGMSSHQRRRTRNTHREGRSPNSSRYGNQSKSSMSTPYGSKHTMNSGHSTPSRTSRSRNHRHQSKLSRKAPSSVASSAASLSYSSLDDIL